MKNFIFPQIFKPVVGEQNWSLVEWQKTSRKIQTQLQIKQKDTHQKGIKLNMLVKSSKSNLSMRKSQKSLRQGEAGLFQNHELLNKDISLKYEKQKFNTGKFDTIQQCSQDRQKNQIRKQINLAKSTKKSNKNNKLKVHFSLTQGNQNDQSQIKKQQKIKKDNKILKNSQSSTLNKFLIKKFKKQKGKNVKLASQNFQQEQLKSEKSIGSKSQKSGHNGKNSLNSSKNITIKNKSSKKLLSSDSRRKAIQDFTYFQQLLNQKKQYVQNADVKKRNHHEQSSLNKIINYDMVDQESECAIFNSDQSMSDLQQSSKISRRKTFHGFQNTHKQTKLQKKSFSIWDLNKKIDDNDQIIQKQEQQVKKQNSKKKKKVHFGRTSIEQNTNNNLKQFANQYNNQLRTQKQMKAKGFIQRFMKNDSVVSIPEHNSYDDERNRNFTINSKTDLKKGAKLRKIELNNVYNQLNYLRMRLNVSKKPVQQIQTSKPHPQAIILSIDKVLHELQQQRIQRTKINNMMIDFGVKLTKDYVLRQANFREKAKNFVI